MTAAVVLVALLVIVATSAGRSAVSRSRHLIRPPNRLLLIVPDGVAQLRVLLRTGPERSHPPAVSGRVRDDAIVLSTPFAAETLSGAQVTWYGPTGRVLKQFVEP